MPSLVIPLMNEARLASLGIPSTASRWRKADVLGQGWDYN